MEENQTLQKIEKRYRIIAFSVPAVMIVVAFILYSVGTGMTKDIAKQRKALAEKQQKAIEAMQYNQFLEANAASLELINNVIPDESLMIGLVRDFESVVGNSDPQGTVKILSTTPTLVGQYLTINMVANFQAPMEELPKMLTKIHDLPYMVQLLKADSNLAGDSYMHQITLRLYVQNPFSNP